MDFREIPVRELRFGMYVTKLDRPWTDTPFMFQGFVLRTEKQFDALKKFCKTVFVDPEKYDRSAEPSSQTSPPPAPTPRVEPAMQIRGNVAYKRTATVKVELPRAARAFRRSTAVVAEISRALQTQGGVIDSERARQASVQITESVERNPDAITLLAKMQEKGGGVLSRAVEVSVMMAVFGRYLQYSREQLMVLSALGLLQDVGKLRLPQGLLNKSTQFTSEEEALYRSHVNHSVEILSQTPGLPPDFSGLASLHHERYDGSGYPRGLRGNAISLLGSIAGLIDAYDMLIAPAPWGEQISPSVAFGVLFKQRGVKFPPGLVEQFIQCMGAFPVGSVVEMQTGEIGVVISQNLVRRLQPRVMLVRDAKGNPINPHLVLDLMKEPMAGKGKPYSIRLTLDSSQVTIDPKELFL
jgi:HD-GYP domain-containing protein (c-di-GMP phosphodiesterase class II)